MRALRFIAPGLLVAGIVIAASCGGNPDVTINPSGASGSGAMSGSSSSTASSHGGGFEDSAATGFTTSDGGGSGTSCQNTCASLGANCGPVADGCGGILMCGDCTNPGDQCGGGGPNKCGQVACVPKTCTDLGVNCGPSGDSCGGLIPDCGSCSLPETCGGNGTPSVCGIPTSCTNLCLQQTTCSSPGVTTTIKGIVYAPNGVDPLPNITVYVPNAPVDAFTPGITCDSCSAQASGSPLVSAVTDASGSFTITNAPVGANIPLVMQTGRWRRQITIPNVASCVDNPTDTTTTRLPRNKSEGDIPLMAFATGDVDTLECVINKIGVDQSEFTNPTGNGRVHLYKGAGATGARIDGSTPSETQLWGTLTTLEQYDMVLFPCQGDEYKSRLTANGLANVLQYTNDGGRLFTTHYSYVWLHQNGAFDGTATWNSPIDNSSPTPDPQTGYIDQTFPKGALLAQWLFNIGASSTLGQMPINTLRYNFNASIAPSQTWVTIASPMSEPMHYTFNTPVNAQPADQCGRVVFSDFHVENSNNANTVFPSECSAGAMTPQEKMLMFMLFDLGACITPDVPSCTPQTCDSLMLECGPAGDGCGGLLANCGDCPPGQNCNNGVCGTTTCTPKSCMDQGIECGPAGDGCGGLIPSCGDCNSPQTCGGAGTPGQCGGGIPG